MDVSWKLSCTQTCPCCEQLQCWFIFPKMKLCVPLQVPEDEPMLGNGTSLPDGMSEAINGDPSLTPEEIAEKVKQSQDDFKVCFPSFSSSNRKLLVVLARIYVEFVSF